MYTIDRVAENFIGLKIKNEDLQKVFSPDDKKKNYLMRYDNPKKDQFFEILLGMLDKILIL